MRNLRALLGIFLLAGQAAGCGATAVPTGVASPSAHDTPSATAAPTATAATTVLTAPLQTIPAGNGTWGPYGGTAVTVGVYFIDLGGLRYTFTVPTSGWWTNYYRDPDRLAIGKVHGVNGPMTRLFLRSEDGGEVPADACHWNGPNSIRGASVDDLVTALAAVHGFESSKPSDTAVGGYRGKHLRLTVPTDVNVADCDESRYGGLDAFADITPGRVQDFWVFDADGTRHLVWSAFDGNTPAEAQADLTRLMDSLKIEPTTP